ncbi:hypothetical protein [Formosa sp. PL04]|uniref:hypothetical protein n=1 Tax=Formosa sp. PL04 TaxID=3081755 RepID=UPI002981AC6E|nr:hypothetical protein [Formosa sp. PL04]
MKKLIIIFLTFLIVASCKQTQKITDAISKPTAKAVFERNFKDNDSLFQLYNRTYSKAQNNNLELELPTIIHSKSDTSRFKILAYTLHLRHGERFKLESNIEADSLQLVIDVYAFDNDSIVSKKTVVSNAPGSNTISFDVASSNRYKVVIIPHQDIRKNFSIKLFTEPTYAFPVSGKDNSAIQSFWGATRSGGKRSHEGIKTVARSNQLNLLLY